MFILSLEEAKTLRSQFVTLPADSHFRYRPNEQNQICQFIEKRNSDFESLLGNLEKQIRTQVYQGEWWFALVDVSFDRFVQVKCLFQI